MAIIGILIALLLPAVQSARESTRRTRCRAERAMLRAGARSIPADDQDQTAEGAGPLLRVIP